MKSTLLFYLTVQRHEGYIKVKKDFCWKDSAQTTQRQNDLQAKGQFTVEYYIPYREYAY